jgi:pimeloyl-ACP methyl ester carboxylesterase
MPYIETADGTCLFIAERGSGAPVVFTHAWGPRSDEWDYQVPALAEAGLRAV